MDIPTSFSGGCACGAIRYAVTAAPVVMLNCHCRDCQYASGGAFASVLVVPRGALTFTKGEPRYHASQAESGHEFRRGFCATCGTPLVGEGPGIGDFIAIRPGSLDDAGWFEARIHIWTDRAQPWAQFHDDARKFPRELPRRAP